MTVFWGMSVYKAGHVHVIFLVPEQVLPEQVLPDNELTFPLFAPMDPYPVILKSVTTVCGNNLEAAAIFLSYKKTSFYVLNSSLRSD
ncbi:hypothetical protein B2O45_21940 [Salmonella enterica]|uniref:Uncharacterized protein n=1 Tax=Salmonella enterica TaxID=28901 RepID=A0A5U7RST3_SALER|nr:hypothetical protein [Salmonella enterica]EHW6438267.1 hypothetical protein [Salmonella enterica]